jgi:hypothetical membrane protein
MLKLNRIRWTPWIIPLVFFLVVQIIAVIYAPDRYNVIRDQISWLGEEGLTYSWMMNVGWIGFGVLVLLVVGWFKQKEEILSSLLLPMMVLGIALILMGLWNVDSADMITMFHFYALFIAQGSVVLAALLHVFLVKVEKLRLFNLCFAIAMLIPALFSLLIPSIAGFTERLFWLVLAIWLITIYGRIDFHHDKH